jgi:hypothetical protein
MEIDEDGYLVPEMPPPQVCPYPKRWEKIYEEFDGRIRHMRWECQEPINQDDGAKESTRK